MIKMIYFNIIVSSILWGFACVRGDIREDIMLTTVQLIRKQGYPVETYSNVITEDNYLLDIFRIPHGKSLQKNKQAQVPVLLLHGLMRTSKDFVCLGPDKSLGFLLADKGYDVWLGNARGIVYSRKHLTLNPDIDPSYWDFSWHEVGVYDLPAMFELIKNVTKKERFSIIGISEGTTTFYVLASMKPEYNRNVTVMISLAPVAYAGHSNPLLKSLALFEPIITRLITASGIREAIPPTIAQLIYLANAIFCTQKGFFQEICTALIYISAGYDPIQLNKTTVPFVTEVGPGGAIRQFLHYAQNINTGLFRQFDFGRRMNLRKYGTPYPPSYDLSKISTPVALIYSEGDSLSPIKDVERLSNELANCVYKYKVPVRQFNHVDFIIANDVVELVFKQVFFLLENYNKINST